MIPAEQPFMMMIAGPNGSGKTTLTEMLRRRGVDLGHYVNADDIARTLSEPDEARRTLAAQRLAEEQRQECLKDRRSFSFETVMSHPSKIDILEQAKSLDFFVSLYFVGVGNPEINIARVAYRVSRGGHDVPSDRIESRWYRTMGYLSKAIQASDRAYIFDNSSFGGLQAAYSWKAGQGGVVPLGAASSTPVWVQQYVIDALAADTKGNARADEATPAHSLTTGSEAAQVTNRRP